MSSISVRARASSLLLGVALSAMSLDAYAADTWIYEPAGGYSTSAFKSALTSVGATVTSTSSSSWPTSWSGYKLVIIMVPGSTFSATQVNGLYNFVSGGGRLVVVTDANGYAGSRTGYANALLTGLGTSMQFDSKSLFSGCGKTATTITADELTDGLTTMHFAWSDSITGGTALVSAGSSTLVAVDQPSGVTASRPGYDVVAVSDGNMFSTGCTSAVTSAGNNIEFWQNLYICVADPSLCLADDDGDGITVDLDCDDTDPSIGSTDDDGDGYIACIDDCDDADASVHPGSSEVIGDSIDQDCDGLETCYADADLDGYRGAVEIESTDDDCTDSYEAEASLPDGDCDDADATINPGAVEIVGDEIDQNCDDGESCYADGDLDGFAGLDEVASTDEDCDDAGEAIAVDAGQDCDDADPNVYPGAEELAGDEVDQDCDGAEICYADLDLDSFGGLDLVDSTDTDCSDAGEIVDVDAGQDCDDTDPDIFPGAVEIPGDEIDQDCDGGESCYADGDLDGFAGLDELASTDADCDDSGEAVAEDAGQDCDDAEPTVYPGAPEIVGDEIDQDCDGAEICYTDADGDLYRTDDLLDSADTSCAGAGEASVSTAGGDCDDTDPTVYPGATEIVADEIDQDCDGGEDCYSGLDEDGDGYGEEALVASADADCSDAGESLVALGEDCDDYDATVYPGAPESTGDETDSDCDGLEVCFADADDDGYADISGGTVISADISCAQTGENAASEPGEDCDDADATVYPGAAEITDGQDNDCDGHDETWDSDGDGLSNLDEEILGTDPDDPDTDDDALSDGAETDTDPLDADSDDDGLDDGAETELGTDPNDEDTDDDALSDAEETVTDPLDADSDDDGLDDGEELDEETDPLDADSDDDGLSDGDEVDGATNPNDADTDGDGLDDGDELSTGTDPTDDDTDGDGLDDGDEVHDWGTDPLSDDSDGDGLYDNQEVTETHTDPAEADTDGDGLDDGEEIDLVTDPNDADTDGDDLSDGDEHDGETDPTDADSDDDGLDDGVEVQHTGTDPNSVDSDGDGLTDGEEVISWHTDPNDEDSDDDSLSDGTELDLGTNPNEPDSDGGGVDDPVELDNGTDPLDPLDDIPESVTKTGCGGCSSGSPDAALPALLLALALGLRRRVRA